MLERQGSNPILNIRLGDVIEHEYLIGVFVDKLNCRWQLPGKNQNVVNEAGIGHCGNTVVKVRAKNKMIVGLILNHVTKALELLFLPQAFQIIAGTLRY